jgi:hypothetical protein
MNRLSEQVHDFNEECISHGRRTRILDADGITKLSMEDLLKNIIQNGAKNCSKAVFVQYVNKDSTIIDIAATNRNFIISWL